MKTVICTFNLFDLHQNILIVDENNTRVAAISSIDNLGSDIAMICDKFSINNVHLYGSATYANNIIQDIIQANTTKYGNRPIEVEVN